MYYQTVYDHDNAEMEKYCLSSCLFPHLYHGKVDSSQHFFQEGGQKPPAGWGGRMSILGLVIMTHTAT